MRIAPGELRGLRAADCMVQAGGLWIRAGDHLVFVGFCAGLIWGACLVEWSYGPSRHWSPSQRALRWTQDRLAQVKRSVHSLDRRLAMAGRQRLCGDGDPWDGMGPGEGCGLSGSVPAGRCGGRCPAAQPALAPRSADRGLQWRPAGSGPRSLPRLWRTG